MNQDNNPWPNETNWNWTGSEYNYLQREEIGTGIGTTYFYNALWDLTKYLKNKPFKNGEKATLFIFGDAEKMDDSPDDWYQKDKTAWEEKLKIECARLRQLNAQNDDPLNRQKRISTTAKDTLRQTTENVCGLMKELRERVDRIMFIHTADKDKNLQCDQNKSTFMFTRLFDLHLHNDCHVMKKFDLHFIAEQSNLKEIASRAVCGYKSELCCQTAMIGNENLKINQDSCTTYHSTSSSNSIFYSEFNGQRGWTLNYNGVNYFKKDSEQCCPLKGNDETLTFTHGASSIDVQCNKAYANVGACLDEFRNT